MLKSQRLSQQNIADLCNVYKKMVNRVFKCANELEIFLPLYENDTDTVLAEKFLVSTNKSNPINGCLTTLTFARSYFITKYVKSFFGPNTRRIAVPMTKIVLLSYSTG